MLLVSFCWLHAICCLQLATYYMLLASGYLLPSCFLLLVICNLLLATCYLLLATCYLLLVICYLLQAIYYRLFATLYLRSATGYMFLVTWYLLPGTSNLIHIDWHMLYSGMGNIIKPTLHKTQKRKLVSCPELCSAQPQLASGILLKIKFFGHFRIFFVCFFILASKI